MAAVPWRVNAYCQSTPWLTSIRAMSNPIQRLAAKAIPASKVSVVDLFCGVGGLSHGMKLEGFRIAAGIDLDPTCKFPFEHNNNSVFIDLRVPVS